MAFVVPTLCGGAIHNLMLTTDGRMVSLGEAHDFELESALVALGAELPRCLWHYKRWLKHPLAWMQGPLFNAWVLDSRLDSRVFSVPLGVRWKNTDFRFLTGLLLLDMAEHLASSLSYGPNVDLLLQPVYMARMAYADGRKHRDIRFALAEFNEMLAERRRQFPPDDVDNQILWFIAAAVSYAIDGWWLDYNNTRLNYLYDVYLRLGDAAELDMWLRSRIAVVLASLVEQGRWPSM
jgi:hypothetical protein